MRPTTNLSKPSAVILSILSAVVLSAGICSCDNMTTYDVTMRDGTELATDVYNKPGAASTPTVVIRTPYGREGNESTAQGLVDLGYSAVSQDIRGTGESGGEFLMFRDDGWGLTQDGFDTVEWAAAGNWSNEEAGLWGGSALAITSLLAAGAAPPSLKCAFTLAGTGDIFHHLAYQGGALREELVVNWCVALG
ncbi:CocE/NonD family hydrolase, partial [Thermodesulfobacteriota bacterium]